MVDAVDQVKISGEVNWQQINFAVPAGSHELQWRYAKSFSTAVGQDRGWVDQIYFGTNAVIIPQPPGILIQPVSQTVDAADVAKLSVAATGSAPLGYQWFLNGTNVHDGGNISGATTSDLMLVNVLDAQAGNYYVVVSNFAGTIASTSARLTVLPTIDLAEALDAVELFVTTSGDVPWAGHTVVTHDGVDAARSGRITNSQHSAMETMVNGPGTLSFWWKVSSETNADVLTFAVNGVVQQTISGEVDWQKFTLDLPAGAQFLDWNYAKNGSGSAGADRGWVDQLTFVPPGAVIIPTNTPTGAMAIRIAVLDGKAQLTWDANTAKTYKVFYKDHLTDAAWTQLDGEILVTWKVVDGAIVPDVVLATMQDVLAGQTRFYKVLEY